MKTVFVVLHYLTATDTTACIESILGNLDPHVADYEIIVVDNFSNNGSLEVLQEVFASKSRVHLLPLNENLGFARGNNAGYQMAQTVLHADFIVMINNDTVIRQPEFLTELVAKFQSDPFDVLGPDIITTDGRHQNPKALAGYDPATVQRKIRRVRRDLWLTKTNIYSLLIAVDRIRNIKRSQSGKSSASSVDLKAVDNIVPHGSCLIFSPRYVQRFKGIFSGTFLYCEEEILWHIAQQERLRIVFWPRLQILHLEDRATIASTRSTRQKRIFKLTHELYSLRQLKAMMADPQVYRSDLMIESV